MKTLNPLLLAALILLTGCNTTNQLTYLPMSATTTGIDFREYSDKGFLFTPEGFSGEYETRGFLTTTIWPQASRPEFTYTQKRVGPWTEQQVRIDDAVKKMYEDAVAMGADAVIRFLASPITEEVTVGQIGSVPEVFRRNGITVSGYAIRRR
jgi:hypothetical protein